MKLIVIGNIVALFASALMAAIGLIKDRKKIIGAQCGVHTLFVIANFLLGGISGAIANILSLVRNIVCIKWKLTLWFKLLFLAIQLALTVIFNREGALGYLPVAAACGYTFLMDVKDAVKLKLLIMACQALWAVYDIVIRNYTGFAFDLLTIVLNAVGIVMILKGKKEREA